MEVERGEESRSLGKTCWRPLLPAMLDLTCPSGSPSKRIKRVTDTSPRLLPRGGSESPRIRSARSSSAGHPSAALPRPRTQPGTPMPSRARRPALPRTSRARAAWPPSPGSPDHPSLRSCGGPTPAPLGGAASVPGPPARQPAPKATPRSSPARWRRLRRRRLRSERAPPCTEQGSRRARRLARRGGDAGAGWRGVPALLARRRASGAPGTQGRELGGGRSHRGAPPRPRSSPARSAGASPAGAGPARSTRGAGGGNRAAEAAAPRRPAPRRRVRAQPARSAAGG